MKESEKQMQVELLQEKQKAKQHMHAGPRTEPHAEKDDRRNSLSVQLHTTNCDSVQKQQAPPRGVEPLFSD